MSGRYFLGIFPGAATLDALEEICYGLRGARWETREKFHITLRFMGEVEGTRINHIREALKNLHCPSFEVGVRGLGHFPLRGDPKVLWAGIEESGELGELQRKLESVVVRAGGLKPEGRHFHPHITLARFKNVSGKRVAEFYQTHSPFRAPPIEVTGFSLVSSTLTESGSRYRIEEEFVFC